MELLTDQELKELNEFFSNKKGLPKEMRLDVGTLITDVPKFIETQLNILKPGNSPAVQRPALDRIRKLRELLDPENGL